jgi:hemerythrin
MTDVILWYDELSVGIEPIDEQHKILVGLINTLYEETIIKKGDLSILNDTLKILLQYTVIHFAVEESLFRLLDYPNYETHKKQHEELKKEVDNIYNCVQEGNHAVNLELFMFLRRWLETHILIEDKEGCAFLLKKGLKRSVQNLTDKNHNLSDFHFLKIMI